VKFGAFAAGGGDGCLYCVEGSSALSWGDEDSVRRATANGDV
jgi:hypothetical protein